MDLQSILSVVSTIIWVVVGLAAVGGILWFMLYWKKFNKSVLVLDETTGGDVVREDKARELYNEKGIVEWRIRKEKITMSCPPKEATLNKGGKKFAILVRVQGDQYHWLDVSSFKADAVKQTGKYFVISEDAKRQLADQLRKAEQERTTKMNQLITQIMPIAAIAVLLIGAYFIYDAVAGHMSEMADKFTSAAGQMAEAAKMNKEAIAEMRGLLNQANGVTPGQDIVVTPPTRPAPN